MASRRSEEPLSPGDRIGRFEVRRAIGDGGAALVYEARHVTLRHIAAVKVLRQELARDSFHRARFDREAEALASIRSRHVPQLFDAGELPTGAPYMLMERLRGETLGTWLASTPRMPIALATEIAIQLASALAAVHAGGFVHRDVKPDNILLHEESDGRLVLELFDFGICTPLASDHDRLTFPGTTVGTPEHMAPEQARGFPVDERADIFSAGTVMFEMLTGRGPFEDKGKSPMEVANAVVRESAPPVSMFASDCPPELARIVARALAAEADDRYGSAMELRDELVSFAEAADLRRDPAVHQLSPRRTGSLGFQMRHIAEIAAAQSLPDDIDELPIRGRYWGRAAAVLVGALGVGALTLSLSGDPHQVYARIESVADEVWAATVGRAPAPAEAHALTPDPEELSASAWDETPPATTVGTLVPSLPIDDASAGEPDAATTLDAAAPSLAEQPRTRRRRRARATPAAAIGDASVSDAAMADAAMADATLPDAAPRDAALYDAAATDAASSDAAPPDATMGGSATRASVAAEVSAAFEAAGSSLAPPVRPAPARDEDRDDDHGPPPITAVFGAPAENLPNNPFH